MTPEKEKLWVLFLEDNPADQRLIKLLFERAAVADFRLIIASDLAEAEKVLGEDGIQVMLVDLELPDSRGLHAVEYLSEHWPTIPIVVLTGHDDERLGLNAVKIGAQDYLIKGQVTRENMLRAVRYAVERKRSQVLLEQQAAKQAAIVKLSHEALREKHLDHLLRHAVDMVCNTLNISGCCITRYTAETDQVELMACHGLANPEHGAKDSAFIRAVLQRKGPLTIENVDQMKSATQLPGWIRANNISALHCVTIPQDQTPYGVLCVYHTSPHLFSPEDQAFLEVVVNVLEEALERFRTRQGLERALEKARHSEQVKKLFLSNMSHEIRTPLNSILGFMSMIETSVADKIDEEERSFFGLMRESSERLMRTVHEVLDIAQIEAEAFDLAPEVLDVCELVHAHAAEWREQAMAKRLKLTIRCPENRLIITADRYSIAEALNHLVDNAIKYTDQGTVSISARSTDNGIILKVKDTGIGMSPRYLKNIFQAFTQESSGYSKKFQGVGLGLALTKRYLELNDVGIDVKSTQNKGTCVTLAFSKITA